MVIITTDGMENASRDFAYQKIKNRYYNKVKKYVIIKLYERYKI